MDLHKNVDFGALGKMIFAVAMILSGVLFAAKGGYDLVQECRLVSRARLVPGKVAYFGVRTGNRGPVNGFPEIEYTNPRGSVIRFTSAARIYDENEPVQVYCSDTAPYNSVKDWGSQYGFRLFLIFTGLAFIGFGIYAFIIARRPENKEPQLC